MNTALLAQSFSSAIRWNGIAHAITQLLFFLRTAILYATLSAQDFSLWAQSMSVMFLLLLWFDCGFRKSIPRYATQLGIHNPLLYRIILFHITIQLAGIPFFYVALIKLTDNTPVIAILCALYLAEGLHALMHTIYHAHFHARSFNQIALTAALIEISLLIVLTLLAGESSQLLMGLLIIKLCTTTGATIQTVRQLQYQPTVHTVQHSELKFTSFAVHSGAMWASTLLKSGTERNILIPVVTYYMGPEMASICKLANDGAVHIYRIVIKTIGSADTALLAHIEEGYTETSEKRTAIESALVKLTTQVTRLILPLLGIIGICMLVSYMMSYDQSVFHAFFIMAVGYLIETLWAPYERLLEVKQEYRVLFLSYVPYVLLVSVLFLFLYISCIGLLPFLLFLQGVRLVTGLLLRTQVYRLFHI